jgi:cell wall-associated NlpC family hydrolase
VESLGLALLIAGGLVVRQVAVGRAAYLGTDTRDMFAALLRNDTAALSEIASRRGQGLPDANAISPASTSYAAEAASASGAQLVSEMKRLAAIANNRYVYGAEGPNAYDCSGLVWRACVELGFYTGSRFTTSSWKGVAARFATSVSVPAYGDVVVWDTAKGHMGVVVGTDSMYSALNSNVGIVTSPISRETQQQGTPEYWRITASANVGGGGGGTWTKK